MTSTARSGESRSGGILFEERQRFRQLWLWLIILSATFVLLRSAQTDRFSLPLIVGFLVGVSLPVLFYLSELRVRVEPAGVFIRFFPLARRKIAASDIVRCEARTYRPIREYGGWGVRYSWGHGMAYNVSGNRGVQLKLRDGKEVLIGSQQAEQLEAAIRQAASQIGP